MKIDLTTIKKWANLTWLAATLVVASAASAHAQSKVIEYWTWNNEGDYVNVDTSAIERFEIANPDIRVDITYVPYGDYMTKLKAALAANQPPDIFQVPWDSGFRSLAESGKLAPMGKILGTGFPAIRQSAKDFVTLGGEVWAMPLDLNTLQIAYNKSIFTKLGLTPPTTTDQLIAVASKLNDAGIFGVALGTKDKWAGGDAWFAQLVYTDPSGKKLSAADAGNLAWDDSVFVAAADRVANLVSARVFAPGANSMGAFNESLDLFVSGLSAMFYPVGNFISGGINDKIGGDFEWGLFPFPGDAGQTPAPTGGIARMFALPAGGEDNEAAADFLRTLADSDGEASLMQFGFIPSWPAETPGDTSEINKNFIKAQALARSRTIYTPPVNAALLNGMQAIFDGSDRGANLAAAMAAAAE